MLTIKTKADRKALAKLIDQVAKEGNADDLQLIVGAVFSALHNIELRKNGFEIVSDGSFVTIIPPKNPIPEADRIIGRMNAMRDADADMFFRPFNAGSAGRKE